MDIFIAVVVLALVVLAVKYYLDHKKPDVVVNPEPEAPYKVEPPVETPVETSVAPVVITPVVAAPVKPATPELKVVNGAKRSLAPKTPTQRVKKRLDVKPAINPVAKPAAKPKSPRKPKPTSTPTP